VLPAEAAGEAELRTMATPLSEEAVTTLTRRMTTMTQRVGDVGGTMGAGLAVCAAVQTSGNAAACWPWRPAS
jgi:hypothetical protein